MKWLTRIRSSLRIPPLVLVSAAVLLLGAAVFGAYAVYDYTEHNPEFCSSCHIMDEAYSGWKESPHRGVNCHDCHQLPYMERAKLVVSFVMERPDAIPPRHGKIIVPYRHCIGCHLDGAASELRPIRRTAGHKKHFFEEGVECSTCHGTRDHVFIPIKESCAACHSRQSGSDHEERGVNCMACHGFLSSDYPTLIPEPERCLACHDPGAGSRDHPEVQVGMKCTACHKLHGSLENK